MKGLLINYNDLTKHHEKLHKKIGHPPETSFSIALVLVITSDGITKLNSVEQKERINYLNNDTFIQNIKGSYYIICKKNEICELAFSPDQYLEIVLKAIQSNFDNDTIIWTSVDIKSKNFVKKLEIYIRNGFKYPYVVTKSPLGFSESYRIALIRKNKISEKSNVDSVLNELSYVMEQLYKRTCSLSSRITKGAASFLQKLTTTGIKMDSNGEMSQKETTGMLYVRSISKENNKLIYEIDVDKTTIEDGEEEDVDVTSTLYNFHTHPKAAYVRHNVRKAWPSCTDYLGFVKLKRTIFHCVVTIEGVYIISFGKYWSEKIDKIDKNFIKDNYKINHKDNYSPEEYVQYVNSILNNGHSIFDVIFLRWKDSQKIFSVNFKKTGNNCITMDRTQEVYNRIK